MIFLSSNLFFFIGLETKKTESSFPSPLILLFDDLTNYRWCSDGIPLLVFAPFSLSQVIFCLFSTFYPFLVFIWLRFPSVRSTFSDLVPVLLPCCSYLVFWWWFVEIDMPLEVFSTTCSSGVDETLEDLCASSLWYLWYAVALNASKSGCWRHCSHQDFTGWLCSRP